MYIKKICISIFLSIILLVSYSQNKNQKNISFIVNGNCDQCKHRIETALKTKGIYKATWNAETQLLGVSFDSIKYNKQLIQEKLAAVGHESEGFVVNDKVYNKLPGCCRYDRDVKAIEISGTVKPIEVITDTTLLIKNTTIKPLLPKDTNSKKLDEVVVSSKNFGTYISSKMVTNTLSITTKELKKAACCNLSESFETSPSIDVNYTDAVTGIKQIQLLGLSGSYTQITTENVAELRGLAGSFGLTFIPGPFIEEVQVTKGTGSVANGYESIAGQINIEEQKPFEKEKIFINAYANTYGRLETSINLKQKVNDKLSTALLLHANGVVTKNDVNNDGFLDMPLGRQINAINRWYYKNDKGLEAQIIVKALQDKRIAGQFYFDEGKDRLTLHNYGVGIDVSQYTVTGKIGYLFKDKPYKSIGLMMSFTDYTNNSYYGLNEYDGKQQSFYANLIFQSVIGTTTHKYRAGFSFLDDRYRETFFKNIFNRKEIVPGAFAEYTFTPDEKFTAIVGLRADNHNYFNWFGTARLNLKYSFNKNTTARFSIGNGTRLANIFAENTGYFVSSRSYNIVSGNNYGYGLQQEKALNYGINITHKFKLNNHTGTISIDAYRTNFFNQTVADVDTYAQKILFYSSENTSFSNSIQAEVNYEIITKLDLRMAYRFLDVQTTYGSSLLQKPLLAKHRAFINIAYQTRSNWLFDVTMQWIGSKRLANTSANPDDKQMSAYSPGYFQASMQITKQFGKHWDIYSGAENLTNFVQEYSIIDAKNPFGSYFDASLVWGPTNGRIIYVGMRYRL